MRTVVSLPNFFRQSLPSALFSDNPQKRNSSLSMPLPGPDLLPVSRGKRKRRELHSYKPGRARNAARRQYAHSRKTLMSKTALRHLHQRFRDLPPSSSAFRTFALLSLPGCSGNDIRFFRQRRTFRNCNQIIPQKCQHL